MTYFEKVKARRQIRKAMWHHIKEEWPNIKAAVKSNDSDALDASLGRLKDIGEDLGKRVERINKA